MDHEDTTPTDHQVNSTETSETSSENETDSYMAGASLSFADRLQSAIKKNIQAQKAEEPSVETQEEVVSEEEVPKPQETAPKAPEVQAPPPWQEQFTQQAEVNKLLLEEIKALRQPQKVEEPTIPQEPKSWETDDVLTRMAKSELGEHATPYAIQEFAKEAREAILYQAHANQPDSPHYEEAKAKLEKFKHRTQKYDESAQMRSEMAAMRAELNSMKAAPQLTQEKAELQKQLSNTFAHATQSFSEAFPQLIEIAKQHDAGTIFAEIAMEKVPYDPSRQEEFFTGTRQVFLDLNSQLHRAQAALKAAGPARQAVLEALTFGADPRVKDLMVKMAGETQGTPRPSKNPPPSVVQNLAPETPPAEDEWARGFNSTLEERIQRAMKKHKVI